MYSSFFDKRILAAVVCVIVCCSCTHYRIVPIYIDNDQPYYAVSVNGVIIPEYAIDHRGKYAHDRHTAKERFLARRSLYGEQIRKKYTIPRSFLYQMKHIPLSFGLVLVSPIVLPIIYVSDLFSHRASKESQKPFKKTVFDYFEIALHEPVTYEVTLQNEFEIVTIHP